MALGESYEEYTRLFYHESVPVSPSPYSEHEVPLAILFALIAFFSFMFSGLGKGSRLRIVAPFVGSTSLVFCIVLVSNIIGVPM